MKIRLIELFAGIGSQATALKRLGADFEHYKICEFDKNAVTSYNALHSTNFAVSDIRDLHGKDLEIVETERCLYILTYSFPCTDLSVAGKRKGMILGSNTRSSLLWEVLRLLRESPVLPQILLMENVIQIHSEENFPQWKRLQYELLKLGYKNYYQDLNACDYGVPQSRKRTFMVSVHGDFSTEKYKFPKPISLQKTLYDLLEKDVRSDFFLSEKAISKLKKSGYTQPKISRTIRIGGGSYYFCNHCWNIVYLPETKKFKTYTEREIFRFMDFSDEEINKLFSTDIVKTQLKKQAGNSICISVLTAIFRGILTIYLKGE
jgi:DNA (cytosine-5)-methyltransferase 1